MFKIIYAILLPVYFFLSLPHVKAGITAPTDSALKEIICKAASNIQFRQSLKIKDYGLLEAFYDNNQYGLQWFYAFTDNAKRNKLLQLVAEPAKYMLEPGPYYLSIIIPAKILSTKTDTLYAEIRYTDAALCFIKDIAYYSNSLVKYNGLKYQPDCIPVVHLLEQALVSGDFEKYINEAEPKNIPYQTIKYTYQNLYSQSIKNDFEEIVVKSKTVSFNNKNLVNKLNQLGYLGIIDTTALQLTNALKQFQRAHNLSVQDQVNTACLKVLNGKVSEKLNELRWNIRWYRWLNCMQNKSFILVNLAANQLTLNENNNVTLSSKIVVGKITTPSPTLTSIINNVIYYPYWNVPYSIATKEMLPKLKRNSSYLDALKIEVLQGSRTFSSSSQINWYHYSRNNFPFNLRQKPGCHNSLGLVKFDFENPFRVYLHDTNVKNVFKSSKRFFSHGCIRVEKPFELALALGVPPDQINMDTCLTDMKPQTIPLLRPMPVIVMYATVEVVDGELRWFEDVYGRRNN